MDQVVEKAKRGDLPHEVRLVATVARLLDLHNSRRERGSRSTNVAQQPQVSVAAGYYLWLGLQTIQLLHRHAKRGSSGPVSIARLHEELSRMIGEVARSDLEYCLSFLSLEREIRYLEPNSLPAEESRVTQTPTQLLRFDKRFGQVRLSDAGRLLMRISALHQDWLYEDKDVERIPASIERGVFEDIPRICDEVIGNLRALNERLTEIEESPTFESLRAEFEERGRQYREMLTMAGIALTRALKALGSPATRERFERWRSFRGIEDLEIEDALSHVEAVHHSLHSLERHFIEFIKNIQSRRRAPLGVIRFQEVCQRLVYSAPSHEALLNLFADLGPWRARSVWFHPSDFIGRADLRAGRDAVSGAVFEDRPAETAQERFQSFLERNRSWMLARLREGPVALSDLVTETDLTFLDGESPASFFGVFSLPDEIADGEVKIFVGLSGVRMDVTVGALRLRGDDPVIWIDGGRA
jgi:hypothetical protein